MTEREIQDHVVRWLTATKRLDLVVPNIQMMGSEADLLAITPTRLMHEIEIKITRADYRADFGKHKHTYFPGDHVRHRVVHPNTKEVVSPSYFWYAVPENLVTLEEVPSYAGLLEVVPGRRAAIRLRKNAPRLHRHKVQDHQLEQFRRSIYFRYWRERLNGALARGAA